MILQTLKGVDEMIKKTYKTDAERIELLDNMTVSGKILVKDARNLDENYLMFIDPEETEPYILEQSDPEPTEIELLQEENANLWFESMSQSAKIEANETEVASLWFEVMQGGM